MTVEIGVIISILVAAIAIATFFIARLKDAEERGALKQRVNDLEKRADKTDAKIDRVLEKLDEISAELSELVSDHRHNVGRKTCTIDTAGGS